MPVSLRRRWQHELWMDEGASIGHGPVGSLRPRCDTLDRVSAAHSSPSESQQLLLAFRARVRSKIEQDLERETAEAERLRAELLSTVRQSVQRARSEGLRGPIWLFGSLAWGTPGARSDIDLLVENPDDEAVLAAALAEHCTRPIHILTLRSAEPSLVMRARREGIPL
jgi:predicted nucleotidyltransferase